MVNYDDKCVYTFTDTPTANQITVVNHSIVDWKYKILIHSIRPIELELNQMGKTQESDSLKFVSMQGVKICM